MKKAIIAVAATILVLGLITVYTKCSKSKAVHKAAQTHEPVVKNVEQGKVLKTMYFEVKVNEVTMHTKTRTDRAFPEITAENGATFLILNVTCKNTSKESRNLVTGSIEVVTTMGNRYIFDQAEKVFVKGWNNGLEQINPLTSSTLNIAYNVPKDLKGILYYHPGSIEDNQRILLGEVGK